jgi:hypothetical protein
VCIERQQQQQQDLLREFMMQHSLCKSGTRHYQQQQWQQ